MNSSANAPVPQGTQITLPGAQTTHDPTSPAFRALVREEVRELLEQDKRKLSIIVNGIDGEGLAFQATFKEVAAHLLEAVPPEIESTVRVNATMVRVNLTNQTTRQNLLTAARNLQESIYPAVFIQRVPLNGISLLPSAVLNMNAAASAAQTAPTSDRKRKPPLPPLHL